MIQLSNKNDAVVNCHSVGMFCFQKKNKTIKVPSTIYVRELNQQRGETLETRLYGILSINKMSHINDAELFNGNDCNPKF